MLISPNVNVQNVSTYLELLKFDKMPAGTRMSLHVDIYVWHVMKAALYAARLPNTPPSPTLENLEL